MVPQPIHCVPPSVPHAYRYIFESVRIGKFKRASGGGPPSTYTCTDKSPPPPHLSQLLRRDSIQADCSDDKKYAQDIIGRDGVIVDQGCARWPRESDQREPVQCGHRHHEGEERHTAAPGGSALMVLGAGGEAAVLKEPAGNAGTGAFTLRPSINEYDNLL